MTFALCEINKEKNHLNFGNRGLFCMSMRDRDLIKSTRPLTATVVHSHRNQILHFEILFKIQMVAGTCKNE